MKDELSHIYTGDEISVLHLKALLEEKSILSIIKNNLQSGLAAGFVSGPPASIELYIDEVDMAAAAPIIENFHKSYEA